jgi:ADP-ribosylglycohydrolase
MIGQGPFCLKPGQWTDDTSMALCLAYSLLNKNTFDAYDQMCLYLKWWREGLFSSTGNCFDIGNTVATALQRFEDTQEPFAGSTDHRAAGNGSLMRLAPVVLFYASNPSEAIQRAGQSSKTTHGNIEAVDACRYFSAVLLGALYGVKKEELLSNLYSPRSEYWDFHPLCESISNIAKGSYKNKSRGEIESTGYVVHTLEAALWAFYNSDTFESGLIRATNLAGDADTIGAVYGQLAGAYYGELDIPFDWIKKLSHYHYFYYFADEFVMYYAGKELS